jgi:EAL domain-containing protein (putative c-di-GMP-specific phosphodiesterase class I)/GGDEF domain-containing protein
MMTIYRKKLSKMQAYSLLSLILFICVASAIQFYNPELLLTGTALTLSVFTMYLTLQNPDNLRDEMTGMMNNEGYVFFMRQRISTHKMSNMIFISIDDFDMLCDSFGLKNVNSAIIQMAKYIKTNVEKSDCFRITKSHFLIVPKKKKAFDEGVVKLTDRLKKPWIIGNNEIHFSVSMIYSTDIVHKRNAEDLLILLHELVLMVKKKKEGIPIKSKFIEIADLYREIRIEEAMKEALEKHTLEVYLQPVYSVTQNKFTSAEALLRFTHPVLGKISPGEMIPLAEKNGMIVKIGEYVLDEVCRFIKENDIRETENLEYVSINVSATEMLQNTFPKEVIRTINKYGIDPSAIVFEMTEYVVVTSNDAVRRNMNKLQDFGVGFTLDDFGSGFSNIESIMKLPFTTIKLDRSLLTECFYNEKSSIILDRTVKLIHELGMYALVEGVETAFQYDMINKLRADYSQGYYNAFPMPMQECLDFVVKSGEI